GLLRRWPDRGRAGGKAPPGAPRRLPAQSAGPRHRDPAFAASRPPLRVSGTRMSWVALAVVLCACSERPQVPILTHHSIWRGADERGRDGDRLPRRGALAASRPSRREGPRGGAEVAAGNRGAPEPAGRGLRLPVQRKPWPPALGGAGGRLSGRGFGLRARWGRSLRAFPQGSLRPADAGR